MRAVAKGARKPGAKISGRSDVLNVNRLLIATGKSLDIITQAEGIEAFRPLRQDLERLSYSLYYAELTQHFGQGLSDESDLYFELLVSSIRMQAEQKADPALLCLTFELQLLQLLGYKPELDACVICRSALTDYLLGAFITILVALCAERCFTRKAHIVREADSTGFDNSKRGSGSIHITPLVWKRLVLANQGSIGASETVMPQNIVRANQAARRLIQGYLEHRAGRRMKALDLIAQL